jgi:hypothetical protein
VILRSGLRLKSSVCSTEIVVVRPGNGEIDLRCGGQPVLPFDGEPSSEATIDPTFSAGTLMGKRYADEATGLEVLVTKSGKGSLSIGNVVLPLQQAKALPASD